MKNLCARLSFFISFLLLLPNLVLAIKFGRQIIDRGQLTFGLGYDIFFMSKIPGFLLSVYFVATTLLVLSYIREDQSETRNFALFANVISLVVVIGWYYLRHSIFENIQ